MKNKSINLPHTPYFSLALVALLTLSACSSFDSVLESKVDYRSGSDNLNRNPLEIPPDLTNPKQIPSTSAQYSAPGATTYSTLDTTNAVLNKQTGNVLPSTGNHAKLMQDGKERWLVVDAPPEKIWPQIREFWLNQGFALEIDNPSIGIIETDWLENRAKLPQNWLRKSIGKIVDNVMSTGEMDKYRMRIERGPHNNTEIYLSHRGMVEVFKKTGKSNGVATSHMHAETMWTARPSDPSLEAEMLSMMLQQLGVKEEAAKTTVAKPQTTQARATLVKIEDKQILALDDTIDRAWRRVGLALDRIGYVVIDRNRAEGNYYVRRAAEDIAKEDKPGLLSSLAFWRSKADKPKAVELAVDQPADFEVQLRQTKAQTGIQTLVIFVPKTEMGRKADMAQLFDKLITELK